MGTVWGAGATDMHLSPIERGAAFLWLDPHCRFCCFLFALCFTTITAIAQLHQFRRHRLFGTRNLATGILKTVFWYQFLVPVSDTSFWSVCHGHN